MNKIIKISLISAVLCISYANAGEKIEGSHLRKMVNEKKASTIIKKQIVKANVLPLINPKGTPKNNLTRINSVQNVKTRRMELPKLKKDTKEVKAKKTPDQLKYERIMKILSKVNEKSDTLVIKEKKSEENNKKIDTINKLVLPEPISSLSIQGKIIVFALIQINNVNKAAKNSGSQLKTLITADKETSKIDPSLFKYQNIVIGYKMKKIQLHVGEMFSVWKVESMTENKVVYVNNKTNEKITKFY